jgi:hypothetical protein
MCRTQAVPFSMFSTTEKLMSQYLAANSRPFGDEPALIRTGRGFW